MLLIFSKMCLMLTPFCVCFPCRRFGSDGYLHAAPSLVHFRPSPPRLGGRVLSLFPNTSISLIHSPLVTTLIPSYGL